DEEQRAAHALLERRGLTPSTVARARELLSVQRSVVPVDETDTAAYRGRHRRAEEALWSWYLEWSGIARVAIRSRGLRRRLGFGARGAEPDDDDSEIISGRADLPA